jgi:putative FmdB family regulatory protein
MPVYEYACTECGLRFERHQSFTDEPLEICPECDGQVRRIIHPARVIFKGSGFYVTDNRRISGGSDRKAKSDSDTASNGKTKSTESSTPKSEPEKSSSESKSGSESKKQT